MLSLVPRIFSTAWAQLPGGKPPAEETPTHGYVITKAVKGSHSPADYTFVLTRDEIYIPTAVRKPAGNGPFPAITMGFGEGKRGMLKVEELVARLAPMQDRMIGRGYVVATVNYRNEVPHLYEQFQGPPENLPDSISGERRTLKSYPTLDHEDLIAIMRYLRTLPYVDKNAIGAMGVSHSGEMILKAAAEYDFAAGVCIEPAAHEFLSVNTGPSAPRKGTEIQYNDIEVVRKNANKAAAVDRIRRIKTPILIFGRDSDHLNGIFKLTNEWMRKADKDVTWYSFDHPEHGYVFIFPQPDGSYKPDKIQEKTFDIFMAYFDKHLKRTGTQ
jgi:dienelactone hydrolase